jgi:nicotinate (nicotinamide) nucleotide adenylyltransferase
MVWLMKSFRGATGVLGVFGGAFDPPHIGHVMLPTYLRARRLVDRLLVAPCADHPLGKTMSPFADRLAWTRAAMAVHGDGVEVSELEAALATREPGPSYTIRLLEAVAAAHPDARVRLVIGSDIVRTGETQRWHEWDRIVQRFAPIVVPRAGHADASQVQLPDVSSTQVRQLLQADTEEARATLAQLVPAAVLEAITRAPHAEEIWLVGRGHVWSHAEPWLRGHGHPVSSLRAHDMNASDAVWPSTRPAAVWLLVRDDALAQVASAACGRIPAGTPVLHAAGALPSRDPRALGALARAGHPVGTLHPICSLRAERTWPSHLGEAAFGIEGDPAAREVALSWIGDQPWLDLQGLDERGRRAYHGACALAANHLAVLQATAGEVLRAQGHPRAQVDAALGVLLRSALENLLALGIPAGVTGPVARGDAATVRGHLEALEPDARALYRVLSEQLERLLAKTPEAENGLP